MDNRDFADLYLQDSPDPQPSGARTLVVGEVLWDRFADATRLGGAPFNVTVHLSRLRHRPLLISALGNDALGDEARSAFAMLGVDDRFIQSTDQFDTGSAVVHVGRDEQTAFTIERPAAYDAVQLTDASVQQLVAWEPTWCYYGTLFPSSPNGRKVLGQLLDALPRARRFYDLNLRPGFESPSLVGDLLRRADVVKLNERELQFVHEQLDLPSDPERFCRVGSDRYGWLAACVTMGARGCVMLVGDDCVGAPGCPVDVADPVGAGDAFAAAFIHGIVANWPAARVAATANRIGAFVASRAGAIPDGLPEDQGLRVCAGDPFWRP